jgi:hypothetical protein
VRSFDHLLGLRNDSPDPRGGEFYKLRHVLLFLSLAVVTGGNSYRSIVTFIKAHRRRLDAARGPRRGRKRLAVPDQAHRSYHPQ